MIELIIKALEAKDFSYAPYSKFSVGAALQTSDGKVFTGCNIENSAFSPTICAERTAFAKALSEGEKAFKAIAVVSSSDKIITPCGVCRQFMSEFCDEDFNIICALDAENYKIFNLGELLPKSFALGEKI